MLMNGTGQASFARGPLVRVLFSMSTWGMRLMATAIGLLLVCGVGLSTSRGSGGVRELLQYRSTMQELMETLRTMRVRASATRQWVQLHVDAARGVFQLTTLREESNPFEVVERTIWLPPGLQVSSAPATVQAPPTGGVSPTVILVEAPTYQRLFRLTMDAAGAVSLHEDPAL